MLLRDILREDPQIVAWVRVVQEADPDVLVIGDIDFDLNGVALSALAGLLGSYPYSFTRRPNRGLDSGRDLNGDSRLGGPEDAEGYAAFAGQGGMAVLSRFPIDADSMVDLSHFNWSDLPGELSVGDGRDPQRLSTTVHWDLPILVSDTTRLHLLTWHATAPVFDGSEDRNGRRNHDETRLWHLYVQGALEIDAPDGFVILGTANADPFDGESRSDGLRALLDDPIVQDPQPTSKGGELAALRDGGENDRHKGPAQMDTVDWPDDAGRPGNLRVDYVLPAAHLRVTGSGVLWPGPEALLGRDVTLASRHRLIWVDIQMSQSLADGG